MAAPFALKKFTAFVPHPRHSQMLPPAFRTVMAAASNATSTASSSAAASNASSAAASTTDATSASISKKRKHPTSKKSQYKGVSWVTRNNKWRAEVWHAGRSSYLGLFTNEIDAANACANFVANINGRGGDVAGNFSHVIFKRKRASKTSRFKGVCWHKALRKWQVRAKVGAQHKYLGVFDNEETAARAYDAVAGPLGRKLNFPVGGGPPGSSSGSSGSAAAPRRPRSSSIDMDLRIHLSSNSGLSAAASVGGAVSSAVASAAVPAAPAGASQMECEARLLLSLREQHPNTTQQEEIADSRLRVRGRVLPQADERYLCEVMYLM